MDAKHVILILVNVILKGTDLRDVRHVTLVMDMCHAINAT